MEASLPRLIELREVTARISLRKSAIYDLVSKGVLHKIKLGRKTVFSEAEVDAFVKSKLASIGGDLQ